MNTPSPQEFDEAENVTTPIESAALVADRATHLPEKSEPSEIKLDLSSDPDTAAGDENNDESLVNENNFLFLFPLALLVVFLIFGLALSQR
jgi:hypothetical protein